MSLSFTSCDAVLLNILNNKQPLPYSVKVEYLVLLVATVICKHLSQDLKPQWQGHAHCCASMLPDMEILPTVFYCRLIF